MTILETERLRMRQFREEDVAASFALDSDPEVMRYIGNGATRSYEDTAKILTSMRHYYVDHPGLGVWAAELKVGKEFIGWGALKHLDNTPEIEVGYRLMRQYWGLGYATEIARALVRHGFDEIGLAEICGITHLENAASGRVLEKAGLAYVQDAFFYGSTVRYYRRIR